MSHHGPRLAPLDAAVHNASIHGARGIFALAVFAFHVANSGLPAPDGLAGVLIDHVLRAGEFGVECFFAISGFVIAGSLARSASIGNFIRDRIARLGPVLWASTLVVVGLGLLTGTREVARMPPTEFGVLLIANLAALPGLLPLPQLHPAAWSLSYEAGFYGVLALAFACRNRGAAVKMAILVLTAGLLTVYPRGLPFLAGLAVANGLPQLGGLTAIAARFPLLLTTAFLGLWSVIETLTPGPLINSTLLDWASDARLPLAAAALLCLALGLHGIAAGYGRVLGPLLRSRTVMWLGTISFSFYLFHPLAMAVSKRLLLSTGVAHAAGQFSWIAFGTIALPLSLAIAWASHQVLELRATPALRRFLIRRFAKNTGETTPFTAVARQS